LDDGVSSSAFQELGAKRGGNVTQGDLLVQIEHELIEAQKSAVFWRSQLPLLSEELLKTTAQQSLERATGAIVGLEVARQAIRDA
jgi:hypothetical protein